MEKSVEKLGKCISYLNSKRALNWKTSLGNTIVDEEKTDVVMYFLNLVLLERGYPVVDLFSDIVAMSQNAHYLV